MTASTVYVQADRRRRLTNTVMLGLATLCAAACVAVLFSIVAYVFINGMDYLNFDFFTKAPKPVGDPGGGVKPAIVGTALMVLMGSAFGIPVGMGVGIYVSEYASPRMAAFVRFVADVMTGIPSVVIGIFMYLVVVLWMGHFSGYAGGLALAMIMVPIVARSSEEMLKLVPNSQREAAYALGIPRWRSIVSVVLPSARRGLLTGSLLAISRAAGESAPLLFTAAGSRFVQYNLDREMDSLPVRIYRYAISPYNEQHAQAWTAALILIMLVLVFNIIARAILGRQEQGR
jgi:phosphate transport system permease protein